MKWQRRARLAVGVFLVAFAGLVFFAIRDREEPVVATAVTERVDPAASTETAGGVWTFANGETLRFEHLFNYADGRSRALAVSLRVPEETGRVVTITADEATRREAAATELGTVEFRGNVDVTSNDGLHVMTDEASYDTADQMVRAPGPVRFERGRMTGSGLGATYDRARDRLWLLDRARVTFAPGAGGEDALEVTSGGAGFVRDEHRLQFERGVHVETTDRLIDALEASVTLTEDDTRITFVELRGDARVTRPADSAVNPGNLRTMSSRDMDLRYAEDGRTLRDTTLLGSARIELAGPSPTEGRRIGAERLEVRLSTDGATVTSLAGWDQVEVTLPPTDQSPGQRIRAGTLQAVGEDGLRTASFGGGVEYREAASPGPGRPNGERIARSTSLSLDVEPGFTGVNSARFIENVTFADGEWRGEGPEARYDPSSGVLRFSAVASAADTSRLSDGRIEVVAETLELSVADRKLTAEGGVESVLQPDARRASDESRRMPALLTADQAVYATGAALDYDAAMSVATYSGGARLWQGETLIVAGTITLDDRQGNLSAAGEVHTVMTIEEPGERASTAPTVADAGRLEYDDERRRATYDEAAHLSGPQGDVKAARIELYLAASEDELSRVEAFDDVTAVLEQAYTVTGTHLTYFAEEQRYLVEGAPVRVVERRPSECLESVGALLTFLRSTATINVDGSDGSRSRTRPVACTERRH